MAGSKAYWAISCRKHGTEEGPGGVRWVRVGTPKGKTMRREGGCPRCKADAIAEERMARKKDL